MVDMSERGHYEQDLLWGEDNVLSPAHHAERATRVAGLIPADASSLLDVGAGDGRMLRAISAEDRPTQLFAVDRSFTALGHVLQAKAQASADALPFTSRSFDAVLCTEVLEHLPVGVYEATVAELARIADHTIVLTVPNRENRRRSDVRCHVCNCVYNVPRHLRSFGPDELAGLFPGFAVERTLEFGPVPPSYPRLVRVLAERAGAIRRFGEPTCPQCGARYRYAAPAGANNTGGRSGTARYAKVRNVMPKLGRPYWLGAVYRRTAP